MASNALRFAKGEEHPNVENLDWDKTLIARQTNAGPKNRVAQYRVPVRTHGLSHGVADDFPHQRCEGANRSLENAISPSYQQRKESEGINSHSFHGDHNLFDTDEEHGDISTMSGFSSSLANQVRPDFVLGPIQSKESAAFRLDNQGSGTQPRTNEYDVKDGHTSEGTVLSYTTSSSETSDGDQIDGVGIGGLSSYEYLNHRHEKILLNEMSAVNGLRKAAYNPASQDKLLSGTVECSPSSQHFKPLIKTGDLTVNPFQSWKGSSCRDKRLHKVHSPPPESSACPTPDISTSSLVLSSPRSQRDTCTRQPYLVLDKPQACQASSSRNMERHLGCRGHQCHPTTTPNQVNNIESESSQGELIRKASSKRCHDWKLDYSTVELSLMGYHDLQSQDFEDIPKTGTRIQTEIVKELHPIEKLDMVLSIKIPEGSSKQEQLLSSIPISEYRAIGDLLVEKLGTIAQHFKDARDRRRRVVERLEEEIAKQATTCLDAIHGIDGDLKWLKKAGQDVVRCKV